jgi:hypothetical protein
MEVARNLQVELAELGDRVCAGAERQGNMEDDTCVSSSYNNEYSCHVFRQFCR